MLLSDTGYRRYSKDNPAANRMLITIRATSTARSRMDLAGSLCERPQPMLRRRTGTALSGVKRSTPLE